MAQDRLPAAIFLMGPTAVGKTRVALALAQHFPVDIVSVDSSQVYRGMDVGTAKPSRAERARVPHRLIDIRDPAEPYSAADFCVDALRELTAIGKAGRIPLLVGGTMLYFHALEHGLAPLPRADADVRARLAREARHAGWPTLHERLHALDPRTAAGMHPNDAQRIQRALEIIELTDRTPSYWYQQAKQLRFPYRAIRVGLYPQDRGALHEHIRARFQHMLQDGLVAEVERLRSRGDLGPELPSMRTVGYRQVWQYLTGMLGYNEMLGRAVIATRQLARRQLTWMRGYGSVHYLDGSGPELETACIRYLASKLDREGL